MMWRNISKGFGKEFPRKGEGKPKEKGSKIQAFTFRESGLFKGLHANSVKKLISLNFERRSWAKGACFEALRLGEASSA
jgi:hypothetical protein